MKKGEQMDVVEGRGGVHGVLVLKPPARANKLCECVLFACCCFFFFVCLLWFACLL